MNRVMHTIVILLFTISLISCNNFTNERTAIDIARTSATAPVQVKYIEGRGFSEGVTWAKASSGEWHCIDAAGRILFQLDNTLTPDSSFSHGVALVRGEDNYAEIIDKSGNVVSSTEDGDYDEIRGFISQLGMGVVYKHVNTFQLTEDQYGIIDSEGKWQVPLHKNTLMSRSRGNPTYLGEGCLYTEGNFVGTETVPALIYNIYTGKTFDVASKYLAGAYVMYSQTYALHNAWTRAKNFDDGYGVFFQVGTDKIVFGENDTLFLGSVYSTDISGNITEIISGVSYEKHAYTGMQYGWTDTNPYISRYRDGLFYFTDKHIRGDKQGFFDIHGNMVIDLFDYTIQDYNYMFYDGYCLLSLRNDQNGRFYTVIDKKGNFMFEPRPSNSYSQVWTTCEMFIDEKDSVFNVYDVKGNLIATFDDVKSVSLYSEDIARVTTNDEIYYIDKEGKRLF